VQVAGTPPFSRQWFFNGLPVQGATNLALLLTNVQSSQVGDYSIIVSNAGGPVASAPAHLLVNNRPAIEPLTPIFVHQGEEVRKLIVASDLDGNALSYQVNAGGIPNVVFDAASGLLTWDTAMVPTPMTFPLTVRVTDNGNPVLHSEQTVLISVAEPLRIKAMARTNSTTGITWNSIPGRDYFVQSAGDLTGSTADWDYRHVVTTESNETTWTGERDTDLPQAFYAVAAVALPAGVKPDPNDDVPKFKRDCQLCDSDSYLLYLLVKLNREKDKDYRDNGGSPGPNSEKLWARIVVIMDELKKRGWTFSASGQSVKDPEGNSHKVR
jgi:hypothetical protein